MVIKILAIVFPGLLFLFKYLLPILAEAAISDKEFDWDQIKEELLQFPLDMMFIAVSYIIPKIIETLSSTVIIENDMQKIAQRNPLQEAIIYFVICMVMLFLLPFLVFLSKLCVKWHYQERKRKRNILVAILYIISIVCIVISMFIY